MTFDTLTDFLVLSLAVGTIALTISSSNLFETVRNFVDELSEWLGSLIECSYCLTHWIALAVMLMYRPRLIESGFAWADWTISYFALVALSAAVGGVLLRLLNEDPYVA